MTTSYVHQMTMLQKVDVCRTYLRRRKEEGYEKLSADLIMQYVLANKDVMEFLFAEVERLKAGDFTEEEFQNLCHNSSPDDRCRFEAGCREYQDKLFGPKPS